MWLDLISSLLMDQLITNLLIMTTLMMSLKVINTMEIINLLSSIALQRIQAIEAMENSVARPANAQQQQKILKF